MTIEKKVAPHGDRKDPAGFTDSKRAREIFTKTELLHAPEYLSFQNLILKTGKKIFTSHDKVIISLDSSNFETEEQKTGFALLYISTLTWVFRVLVLPKVKTAGLTFCF